jgi:hypothetical protein
MAFKIEVSGISSMMKRLDEDLGDFVERVMDSTVSEIPKFTPKDTGRARSGWERRGQGLDSRVENAVPYVQYLERPYVKSKQAPRGIIGPTLTSVKGKLR